MIQAHRVIIAPPAESRGLFSRLQGTTGHRTPLEPRGRALGGKDGRQLASQARGLSPRPEARAKALLPAGPGLSRAKGVTDDAGDGLSLGPAAPVPVSLSPRGLGLPAPHHQLHHRPGHSVMSRVLMQLTRVRSRVSAGSPGLGSWGRLAGTAWLRAPLSHGWKDSSSQSHALAAGPRGPSPPHHPRGPHPARGDPQSRARDFF